MTSEQHDAAGGRYHVVAIETADDVWHVTIRELPETSTVAFSSGEIQTRARETIALDVGCHPHDFDVEVTLYLGQRPH